MIQNVVKNITCESAKNIWTEGVKLFLRNRGVLLSRVGIYFENGCAGQVYVQVRVGGQIILPEPSVFDCEPDPVFGDAVVGDGTEFWFYFERELKQSEEVSIWYRNVDKVDTHDIMTSFELKDLPTKKSQLRS